ncbi:MAG TPA: tetratricopeptide repeat protein, partial [Proteobacteria bacterium]|nr:tetratricopeptide repeat protein [Pseudomonadota bacterium]
QGAVELLEEGIPLGLPEDRIRIRLKKLYSALGQDSKAIEQLYLLADMAQSAGDIDGAIAYLEEVLRMDPQDLEARERLKKLYARRGDEVSEKRELFVLIDVARSKGDRVKLEKYLRELVERDPAADSAKLELAELYSATGRLDEAKRMLFDLADEKLRSSDFTMAERVFQKILELDADDEQAKRGLIGIYLDRDQRRRAADMLWDVAKAKMEADALDEAKGILTEVMQIWPEHEEGLRAQIDIALKQDQKDEAISRMLELSELYQREGKFDEAVNILEEAIGLGPDCEPAYQKLAQIHQYLGRSQQAYEVLMRFGDRLRQTGQLQRAVDVLTDILKAAPDNVQARVARKGMYLNLGNRQKAVADLFVLAELMESEPQRQEEFLLEILELEPTNAVAREKLIALYRDQGEVAKAVEQMRYFLNEAMEKERFSEALDRARQILEYEPDNPSNREALAEAYRRLGDTKRAVDELMAAAQMYLDMDDVEKAEQLLRAAVDQDPSSGARLMLSELYRRRGDEEKASQEMHRLADHLASLGALNEAQKILRTVLKYDPADEVALKKLADLERKLGRKDEAVEILFDLASRAKDAGRLDEAEDYYSQVLRIDPLNVEAQSELAGVLVEKGEKERAAENLLVLSSRLALSDKLEEAEAQLDKVLEFLPNHHRALYFKAELAQKRGDVDGAVRNLCAAANASVQDGDPLKAQKLLKQALKLEPLSFEAHDRLVELYIESERTGAAVSELIQFARNLLREERLDEARDKLERARELDPSNRVVLATLKDIALRRDDTESAVELLLKLAETAREQMLSEEEELALKEVLSLDEQNARAHGMLVDKYLRDGRKEMALAEVYRMAELKVRSDDIDDAISLYQRACTIDPDAEMPHRKLLELFLKQGRTRDAIGEHMALADIASKKGYVEKELESLRSVMSLDPLNAEAHTRLKERYLELGRKDDAISELSTFAEALKRENRVVEAIEAYEELLQLQPNDPELLMTLARLLLEADRRQQAIARFEQAAKIAHERARNDLAE